MKSKVNINLEEITIIVGFQGPCSNKYQCLGRLLDVLWYVHTMPREILHVIV